MRVIEQLVYKIQGDTQGFDKSIDSSSKKSKTFERILKGLSIGAIAVAIKKFGDLVAQTNEYLDTIDKMSQKIGVSREAYQEWDFILSQSGASVSGLQMGLKTLSTAVDEANQGTKEYSDMFDRLNVSVVDANGNVKDQEVIFNEVFKALSDMESQTERTALANRLLGRSATELAPAMNGGADAIEDMRDRAHELGLIIEDETVDAGVKLTDNVDKLQRSFKAWRTNAISPVIGILTDLTDKMLGQKKVGDDLRDVTEELYDINSDYKDVLKKLDKNQELLTEKERASLKVKKELLEYQKLEIALDLAKEYNNRTVELDRLGKTTDSLKQQIKEAYDALGPMTDALDEVAVGSSEYEFILEELENTQEFIKRKEKELINVTEEHTQKRNELFSAIDVVRNAIDQELLSLEELSTISPSLVQAIKNIETAEKHMRVATENSTEATKEQTQEEKDRAEGIRLATEKFQRLKNLEKEELEAAKERILAGKEDAETVKAQAYQRELLRLITIELAEATETATNKIIAQTDAIKNMLGSAEDTKDAYVEAFREMYYDEEQMQKARIYDRAQAFREAGMSEVEVAKWVKEQIDQINDEKEEHWTETYSDIISNVTQGATMLADTWSYLNDVQANQHEAEIQRLEEQGASEEEINEKKKQFAQEEASRQKSQATFQAIIDTASAIIGFLADPGGPWGVALSAMAGATGAAQIAAIQSEPVPEFDVGSIRVPQDTQAVVHENEMILPAPIAQQARDEGVSIAPTNSSGNTVIQLMIDGRVMANSTVNKINQGQTNKVNLRFTK